MYKSRRSKFKLGKIGRLDDFELDWNNSKAWLNDYWTSDKGKANRFLYALDEYLYQLVL